MVQWTNLNRNSSVNPWRLPLLCGIFGAIHLALVGLMGRLTGRRNPDKFQNFKMLVFSLC